LKRTTYRAGQKPALQVAAALIEQNGLFLLTKRREGTHLAGLLEFPGGKREAGESLEICLRRELMEELGIQVTPPLWVLTHRYAYPEKEVELHFFSCHMTQGTPTPLDCADCRWVKPDDFCHYQFPPADRPVLQKIRHDLHSQVQSSEFTTPP